MATSEQDGDWKSTKKTVLERSRDIFNNPFMSDVMFSREGSDKFISSACIVIHVIVSYTFVKSICFVTTFPNYMVTI